MKLWLRAMRMIGIRLLLFVLLFAAIGAHVSVVRAAAIGVVVMLFEYEARDWRIE